MATSTTADMGGRAWLDTNNNGIQDSGETGVAGVKITATDLYIGSTLQTTTDANGQYLFSNIVPSYYSLTIDKSTFPAGYSMAAPYQSLDPTLDSDFATISYDTYTFLTANQSDLNIDAGAWTKRGSIGDKVWLDTSLTHSGLNGDSAPGVAGVTVTLYQAGSDGQLGTADDVAVATQISDANGNYKFDNLLDGAYQIGFSNIGANNGFTTPYASGTGYSSVDPLTGKSSEIYLNYAQNIDDIDAGIRNNLGSISGLTWNDTNGDGRQMENVGTILPLPTLSNITVNLYQAGTDNVFGTADDVLIDTKITDADGKYAFGNLAAGQYQVEFIQSDANSIFTSSDGTGDFIGYVGGNPVYYALSYYVNSDVVGNGNRTAPITIAPSQDVSSIDAGVTSKQTTIGDLVWDDTNADGIKDEGELGIAGVTVELRDANGNVLNSTVTNQDGNYLFQNVSAGNYAVHVVAPTDYIFTRQNTFTYAGNSSVDAQGNTPVFSITSYEKNLEKDAGLVKPAIIGDTVWNDTNHNGIQDSGEKGIAGITVNLYSIATSITQTSITDANGHYSFSAIPGQYYLTTNLPANYQLSPFQQGTNPQLDSDILPYGYTNLFTVNSGDHNPDLDIGIYAMSTISGKAWMDNNADGLRNPNELTSAYGNTVELLNEAGQVVSTSYTGADGGYIFYNFYYTDASGVFHGEGITPGNYKIHVVTQNPAFTTTALTTANPDQLPSSVVDTQGYSNVFTLADGENKQALDVGIQSNLSIGDLVWSDVNRNGIQDTGEQGIAGVTLTLSSFDGTQYIQQQTTQTDSSGHYQFDHVPSSPFEITTVAPAGYVYSPAWQGTDQALDSNSFDGSIYDTPTVYTDSTSYDIGMYQKTEISIGDRVWEDANCNGIQDEGEWNKGIAGVTVVLLDAQGQTIATTTTDAQGNYVFAPSTPGDYKIHVEAPAGYTFTGQDQPPMYGYTANSSVNNQGDTNVFTVVAGDTVTNKDAGLYKKASIGDYVWNDVNVNGIQDANETGMAGVTVNLLNASDANKLITSVVTDATGHYTFDNVDLGNYTVQVVAPTGYDFTYPNAGTDPNLNSNIHIDGYSDYQNIWVSGVEAHNIDAGLFNSAGKGSIGDRVWEDANCNGLQDEGEWNKGIANVSVELLNNTGSVISTTHTDSEGKYLFKNLDAGDYKVHMIAPDGYYSTSANQTSSVLGNSVIDSTGQSSTITLAAGENNRAVDAGFYQKASFGDFVWLDANGNGLQDTNESGLASVPVQLFGWINNQMFSQWAVTDSNGYYQFNNIDLGNYTIQVEAPTGYTYTQPFAGTDTSIDSSVGLNGLTQDIHVWISGINDTSLDAGLQLITPAASSALPTLSSLLDTNSSVDSLFPGSSVTSTQVTDPAVSSITDTGTIKIIGQLDDFANQLNGLV